MKPLRHVILLGAFACSFLLNADGPKETPRPSRRIAAELKRLQGTWEGVVVGDKSRGAITISITADSFHFHRDTNFWFDTTMTLPEGTEPQQLHVTIKNSAPPQGNAIGKAVVAIFKIRDGTLTVAARGDGSDEPPNRFEGEGITCYKLRKVTPRRKSSQPLKTEY